MILKLTKMRHTFYLCMIILLISGLYSNITTAQISEIRPRQASMDTSNISMSFVAKYPLVTWLRKSPIEISCMLESELGYKDKAFNCGHKNYVNKGDPCKKTKEYYEGLQIPGYLAPHIYPLIKTISLAFEHGDLQDLSIEFKDSISIDLIKQIFRLPSDRGHFPDNITYIYYGENVTALNKPVDPQYTRWLDIVGLDHMGAGDVDCK